MAKTLREDIEFIRAKLSDRIDILHKHVEEYKDEGKKVESIKCDLKARQLLMVLNDIDKALKIKR